MPSVSGFVSLILLILSKNFWVFFILCSNRIVLVIAAISAFVALLAFRMVNYLPVQRQRLEEVDRAIAEEEMIKEQYFTREKEILNDPDLSEKEREKRIRELQDATFGEEADAFRRGQAIEKGGKEYIKKRTVGSE